MQQFTKIGDSLIVRTTDIDFILRKGALLDVFIKDGDRSDPTTLTCKDEKEAIEIMDDLLRI